MLYRLHAYSILPLLTTDLIILAGVLLIAAYKKIFEILFRISKIAIAGGAQK
jgi:hypothetical protein